MRRAAGSTPWSSSSTMTGDESAVLDLTSDDVARWMRRSRLTTIADAAGRPITRSPSALESPTTRRVGAGRGAVPSWVLWWRPPANSVSVWCRDRGRWRRCLARSCCCGRCVCGARARASPARAAAVQRSDRMVKSPSTVRLTLPVCPRTSERLKPCAHGRRRVPDCTGSCGSDRQRANPTAGGVGAPTVRIQMQTHARNVHLQ